MAEPASGDAQEDPVGKWGLVVNTVGLGLLRVDTNFCSHPKAEPEKEKVERLSRRLGKTESKEKKNKKQLPQKSRQFSYLTIEKDKSQTLPHSCF